MDKPRKTPEERAESIRRATNKRAAVQERRAHSLELRKQGWTLAKIAELHGTTIKTASVDVSTAIKEITREPAQELIELELARLDALYEAANERLQTTDVLFAIDRCLKIMDRRAKLLGLDNTQDAPDHTQMALQVARAAARLAKKHPDLDVDQIVLSAVREP